jgi:hypothetical protein
MIFDFHVPCIIDEAKWYQSNTTDHGTWKWQGGNDGSNWTDIGSPFTLGGAATQTQTQLNGNTTAYRYYRLLGISGNASWNPWLYEIQFKIDYNTTSVPYNYANTGGVGDRNSIITITETLGVGGSITNFINGSYDSAWWSGQPVTGTEIKFDFGVGASKVINDAIWYQQYDATHGTWQWQGSSNNSNWTNIGNQFTLGAQYQSQTELNGNTTAYRYYRLYGISGTFNSGPYIDEIDFSIGDPPSASNVLPNGIASAETFGAPALSIIPHITYGSGITYGGGETYGDTVSVTQNVSPIGITPADALGQPVVTPGVETLLPTGIAPADAFGVPALSLKVLPTGIGTAETFGTPALSLKVTPVGITPADALGQPVVTPGQVTIHPSGIASGEVFGQPSLSLKVSPASIASQEAFGNPAISLQVLPVGISAADAFGTPALGLKIFPTGIAAVDAVGSPVVTPGAVTIQVTGIVSAEAFGTHAVSALGGAILPAGIASQEAFGQPSLGLQILPVGIAPVDAIGTPALTLHISPVGIAPADAFGVPQLGLQVLPAGIAPADAVGSPTIIPGTVIIHPAGIPPVDVFGLPVIVREGVIDTFSIDSQEAVGHPQVIPGVVAIQPTGIGSAESIGHPSLSLKVLPVGIASQEAVGAPAVTVGVETLLPAGIGPADAFGTPSLLVRIYPTSINSGELWGTPRLTLAVLPVGIPSGEAVGTSAAIPGTATLHPAGIASREAMGIPRVWTLGMLLGTGIPSEEIFGVPGVTQTAHILWDAGGIQSGEHFGRPLVRHQATPGLVTLEGKFTIGPVDAVAGDLKVVDLATYRDTKILEGAVGQEEIDLWVEPIRWVSNG